MIDTTPSRGKIGSLPFPIREQVNLRLLNGEIDTQILPWLNALPAVIDRLAERFSSEPISAQNLSNWRTGQFQKWLAERQEIEATKQLSEFSAGLVEAAGLNISSGAKALAAGRMMARLQTMGDDTEMETLLDAIKAVKDLHAGDIQEGKLNLDKARAATADRALLLAENKWHYEAAGKLLDNMEDARAKEIAASDASREVKMDQLIAHIWGAKPGA